MKRALFAVALALPLAGCDLADWSRHRVRAARAEAHGDRIEASAQWQRALDAAERMDSPRRRLQALRTLATLATRAEDPGAAMAHLERALVVAERLHGAAAPELVPTLRELGARSRDAGDLGRSEAVHRRWVEVTETHPATSTGPRAPPRIALAEVLAERGKLSQAIEKYESGLSWLRDEVEGWSLDDAVPRVRLALSRLELFRGRVDDALELAVRAADLPPGRAKPSPALAAAIAQAEAEALLAQPQVAIDRVEAARERARTVSAGTPDEASVLARDRRLEVALAYLRGRLDAARELAEESYGEALARDPEDPAETRAATLALADLVAQVGPLSRAEALYQRLLEADAAARGADHPRVAEDRLALARLALGRRDLDAAAAQLDQAEPDLERAWGIDLTRRKLGPLRARWHLARGESSLARPRIAEAARRWRALGDADPDAWAEVQVVLARTHRQTGNATEAGKAASRAYRVGKTRYGEEHPATLEALMELARAHHDLGQRARAQQALGRALELAEAFLAPTHPWRRELPALADELGL